MSQLGVRTLIKVQIKVQKILEIQLKTIQLYDTKNKKTTKKWISEIYKLYFYTVFTKYSYSNIQMNDTKFRDSCAWFLPFFSCFQWFSLNFEFFRLPESFKSLFFFIFSFIFSIFYPKLIFQKLSGSLKVKNGLF